MPSVLAHRRARAPRCGARAPRRRAGSRSCLISSRAASRLACTPKGRRDAPALRHRHPADAANSRLYRPRVPMRHRGWFLSWGISKTRIESENEATGGVDCAGRMRIRVRSMRIRARSARVGCRSNANSRSRGMRIRVLSMRTRVVSARSARSARSVPPLCVD